MLLIDDLYMQLVTFASHALWLGLLDQVPLYSEIRAEITVVLAASEMLLKAIVNLNETDHGKKLIRIIYLIWKSMYNNWIGFTFHKHYSNYKRNCKSIKSTNQYTCK